VSGAKRGGQFTKEQKGKRREKGTQIVGSRFIAKKVIGLPEKKKVY